MKFFLFSILFFGLNYQIFSQNITAEVQYGIYHYQCNKCLLTGKINELHQILKISDYKYLPHVYFTALHGKGSNGCMKQT